MKKTIKLIVSLSILLSVFQLQSQDLPLDVNCDSDKADCAIDPIYKLYNSELQMVLEEEINKNLNWKN